jgi:hypothetical protein
VTFIFDFGLVSLILYFVTQAKATAKLPHFTYFIREEKTPSMGKRIGVLIGSLVRAGITFLLSLMDHSISAAESSRRSRSSR